MPKVLSLEEFEDLGGRKEVSTLLLQMIGDDDIGALELAKVAGGDPILSAKVMRMANSTYYGLSGRVKDLHFAISVIGLLALRSIAVSVMMERVMPISRDTWRRFLSEAGLAVELSKYFGADQGEAICAGMVMNIGELVLAQHDLRGYPLLHREISKLALYLQDSVAEQRERQIYGKSHSDISRDLLVKWRFPMEICDAVGDHHSWTKEKSTLSKCLYSVSAIFPYYRSRTTELDLELSVPEELMHVDWTSLFARVSKFVGDVLPSFQLT